MLPEKLDRSKLERWFTKNTHSFSEKKLFWSFLEHFTPTKCFNIIVWIECCYQNNDISLRKKIIRVLEKYAPDYTNLFEYVNHAKHEYVSPVEWETISRRVYDEIVK